MGTGSSTKRRRYKITSSPIGWTHTQNDLLDNSAINKIPVIYAPFWIYVLALRWRHNESNGILNHRRLHCLLSCCFRRRSRKTSKLRVTGLCVGYSLVTGEFPAQRASNAEDFSIWWRHHGHFGYILPLEYIGVTLVNTLCRCSMLIQKHINIYLILCAVGLYLQNSNILLKITLQYLHFWYLVVIFPANWRSRNVTMCFTCARNIVFEHKINFCFDVVRIVCFPCVWLCFISISFDFTLGSCVFTLSLRCYRAHGELKVVSSNQHNMTTKTPEHTLGPHDDVIKWKHFPRYWPFVRGLNRSPVNSPHKGQWHGVLMFSLICAWIYGWVNNGEAGELKRHCTHYDVTVMRNQTAVAKHNYRDLAGQRMIYALPNKPCCSHVPNNMAFFHCRSTIYIEYMVTNIWRAIGFLGRFHVIW